MEAMQRYNLRMKDFTVELKSPHALLAFGNVHHGEVPARIMASFLDLFQTQRPMRRSACTPEPAFRGLSSNLKWKKRRALAFLVASDLSYLLRVSVCIRFANVHTQHALLLAKFIVGCCTM